MMTFIPLLLLAQGNDAYLKSYQLYGAYSGINSKLIAFRARLNPAVSPYFQAGGGQFRQDSDDGKHSRSLRDVPRDLLTGVKIVYSDFIHVSTAPARWDKGDLLWVGGFAATTALLFAFDQEIFDAIQRNRDAPGFKQITELGEFFEPVGLMAVQNKNFIIAMGIGYILNFRPLTIISGEILEAFFIAGFYSEGIKMIVGRKRPNQGEGPYSFTFNDGASFPSGHARNITQAAVILSRHIRFLPFQIFAYSVAASVCLQRITSESHWPSDVFVGAMFGAWTAKVMLDYHAQKNIVISPRISLESEYIGFDVKMVLR